MEDGSIVIHRNVVDKQKFKDSRIFLTKVSSLEEIFVTLTKKTLQSMFGKKELKRECMIDTLKIFDFKKDCFATADVEERDDNSLLNDLRQEVVTVCLVWKEFLHEICNVSICFIKENHDSLRSIIINSQQDLESLKRVRKKYISRNYSLVDNEYNKRVLSRLQVFEKDVAFVRTGKCNYSNCKRLELTESVNNIQKKFLSLFNTVPTTALIHLKDVYEENLYEIELEVCKKFKEESSEWADSVTY